MLLLISPTRRLKAAAVFPPFLTGVGAGAAGTLLGASQRVPHYTFPPSPTLHTDLPAPSQFTWDPSMGGHGLGDPIGMTKAPPMPADYEPMQLAAHQPGTEYHDQFRSKNPFSHAYTELPEGGLTPQQQWTASRLGFDPREQAFHESWGHRDQQQPWEQLFSRYAAQRRASLGMANAKTFDKGDSLAESSNPLERYSLARGLSALNAIPNTNAHLAAPELAQQAGEGYAKALKNGLTIAPMMLAGGLPAVPGLIGRGMGLLNTADTAGTVLQGANQFSNKYTDPHSYWSKGMNTASQYVGGPIVHGANILGRGIDKAIPWGEPELEVQRRLLGEHPPVDDPTPRLPGEESPFKPAGPSNPERKMYSDYDRTNGRQGMNPANRVIWDQSAALQPQVAALPPESQQLLRGWVDKRVQELQPQFTGYFRGYHAGGQPKLSDTEAQLLATRAAQAHAQKEVGRWIASGQMPPASSPAPAISSPPVASAAPQPPSGPPAAQAGPQGVQALHSLLSLLSRTGAAPAK